MGALKAVFIDIDNTLLDFDEYVRTCMREGFERFGIGRYEEWMFPVFTRENNRLWRQIEDGTLTFPALQQVRWNNIFSLLGLRFDGAVFEKYFREALFDSAVPVPGAGELLSSLRERYLLCAASNGPYEQQLHRLALAGMAESMDYVFVSEKLGVSKPDGEFFRRSFARLNAGRAPAIVPAECVMIGDSLTSDMAGGRRFGMRTCYYDRSGACNDFPDGRPDIVVTSLAEIPARLRAWERGEEETRHE